MAKNDFIQFVDVVKVYPVLPSAKKKQKLTCMLLGDQSIHEQTT